MPESSIALFVFPPLLLDGLRGLLLGEGWRIAAASSHGAGARATVIDITPSVTVVSLALPPLGGLHLIGALSDSRADLRIVALLDSSSSDNGWCALRAGALSWMSTEHGWEAGHRTLRAASVGDVVLSGDPPPRGTASRPALSRREFQVLHLVHCGHGVKRIAEELVISQKTVKHHLAAIHAKLGVHTRTEAVVRALQIGLLGSSDSLRSIASRERVQASGWSGAGTPSPFSP